MDSVSSVTEKIENTGDIVIKKTVKNIDQSFATVSKDISYLSENIYIGEASVKDISKDTTKTFKGYFHASRQNPGYTGQ